MLFINPPISLSLGRILSKACSYIFTLVLTIIISGCNGSGGQTSLTTSPTTLEPLTKPELKLTRVFPNFTFEQPILALQAPGNNDRWYVVTQRGVIRTFSVGDNATTVFADLTDRVVYSGGQDERGLLGMAFHPDFRTNQQVFLYYINNDSGQRTIVSRYTSPDAGLTITVPEFENEDILLELERPFSNHNGGNLMFGADGYLYIGLGDGGGANDPFLNGLNLQTLLGSMLRIDVDSEPAADKRYAIPGDNPFINNDQALDEIYAYGLRNPWRWSFDSQTGDLYVGDVGQGMLEEINKIKAGEHYGWGCFEGTEINNSYSGNCTGVSNNPPLHEYSRSDGFSVTGGYVYRGQNPSLAAFRGTYFYADFGTGTIWGLNTTSNGSSASNEVLIDSAKNISSFAQDNLGELYVLSWLDGEIFRLDSAIE